MAVRCSGQKLGNPGFESGTPPWTASSGVIDSSTGEPARSGSWKAWLDGYGTTHTDTLSQSVTIPAGCHATLSFYLHIDTAETTGTHGVRQADAHHERHLHGDVSATSTTTRGTPCTPSTSRRSPGRR